MKKCLVLISMLSMHAAFAQTWAQNYDYVNEPSEGLIKVEKNKKIGFVDEKGKVTVPLLYDEAYAYSEGLAAKNRFEMGLY